MNWRDCDDDAGAWDDSVICWEEIEDFTGPMYRMYRDKLESESKSTWRPPLDSWTTVEYYPC